MVEDFLEVAALAALMRRMVTGTTPR
jgi:hypothetical protein